MTTHSTTPPSGTDPKKPRKPRGPLDAATLTSPSGGTYVIKLTES